MLNYDVTIIGGGPAGLAAAISAIENGAKKVLIMERDVRLGGILSQCIHNGFGLHFFDEELTGPEYAQRFIEMLNKTSVEVKLDTMVLSISKDHHIDAINTTDGYFQVQSKSIVLAMGCRERTRGALNIAGTRPSGVFTAGSAQYMVNMQNLMPGNKVVILGSGDIGLIMARRMTWEGAKVELVCELMPYSSGLARNIAQCLDDNDIPLKFNHTVVKIHGKSRLEGVTIARVDEDFKPIKESFEYIECDTLLLSVGLIPENELSNEVGIDMDRKTKGAIVDEMRHCSIDGFFACGNVLHVHDLVDNVSDEAIIAGKSAALYSLGKLEKTREVKITSGDNLSYCLPHKICTKTDKVDIYFRVKSALKASVVEVICDGELIKKVSKIALTPGEMEKIVISPPIDAKEMVVNVRPKGK